MRAIFFQRAFCSCVELSSVCMFVCVRKEGGGWGSLFFQIQTDQTLILDVYCEIPGKLSYACCCIDLEYSWRKVWLKLWVSSSSYKTSEITLWNDYKYHIQGYLIWYFQSLLPTILITYNDCTKYSKYHIQRYWKWYIELVLPIILINYNDCIKQV